MALTFFPRENLLIAKNQCQLPREKIQCHFQTFRQFDEIFREFNQINTEIINLTKFFREFDPIHTINWPIFHKLTVYLVKYLCRNTIARLFLGMH